MINNETELKEATKKLELMGDKLNDTSTEKDFLEFEKLSEEIEAYENIHYPIKEGNPEETEKLKNEYRKDGGKFTS